MQDPRTGTRTTCPARNAEIFSDCLHNLGGPPGFTPPPETLEAALGSLPSAHGGAEDSPVRPMTMDFLTSKLSAASHSTAGGTDECNFYLLLLCPTPVKEWILRIVNLHLTTPMPGSWQESRVFLLYKKGPADKPTNYRPISLLNVLYKLIASYLTTELAGFCNGQGPHHPS